MATAKKKVAFITGITGQDGSYLAEYLLEQGYEVHGLIRRASSFNTGRIEHMFHDIHASGLPLKLHYGDLSDPTSLLFIIAKIKPDEVYNLGAQSHVKVSFDMPDYTAQVSGIGCLNLLEALRSMGVEKKVKFYQASTSELYGLVQSPVQSEKTPFYPRSPYAVAKLFAYWTTINYREAYGIHASNGILFNHESPRRGPTFVTRKITRGVARIYRGKEKCIYLGNLDAKRDWGHAKEYVKAMVAILQKDEPGDYVIATGETHSVREFAEKAFARIGVTLQWQGSGLDEIGVNEKTGDVLIRVDARYYRPTEVEFLLGDATKAKDELGWKAQITFEELVNEMVDEDIKKVDKGDYTS